MRKMKSSKTQILKIILVVVIIIVIVWFYKLDFDLPLYNSSTFIHKNLSTFDKEYEASKIHDIIIEKINKSELIWKQRVMTQYGRHSSIKSYWQLGHFKSIWNLFYQKFNCPHKIDRLGRVGDGGKWICGISHLVKKAKSCVVYSYGVGEDTSFEEDILSRTLCTLRAFDHTVSPENVSLTKMYPKRSTFDQIGLGSIDSENIRTLKTEMIMHDDKFVDILKLDIDGREYESLTQIINDFPNGLPFGQLIIEIHLYGLNQDKLYSEFKLWWETLENAGLRPFNREPNPYSYCCFEYSFLNIRMNHTLLYS